MRKGGRAKNEFTILPVVRYGVIFCVLIVGVIFTSGIWQTVQYMTESARTAGQSVQMQISYRVGESIKVLKMLANSEEYANPNLPLEGKIRRLEQINSQLGYMMICYVDGDMNVYTLEGGTSLASRAYMQKLFSFGTPQVTDSFPAGSDGVTLNYTVAVPLMYENAVSGSIFSAIYFDEVQQILKKSRHNEGVEVMLIGSKNQIMSASVVEHYGVSYLDFIRESMLFGTTADRLEADLLRKSTGEYWSFQNGKLFYTMYNPVENTNWTLISRGDFGQVYLTVLPRIIFLSFLSVLICGGLLWLINRYMKKQMRVTDLLLQSLQELERKIYQDDRPAEVELQDIIQLTSTGLSDGLTGVVTRTVFLNQLKLQIDKFPPNVLAVLCFVDLDDLKKLNDTYGHKTGDVALKSIGYVLREYEKKYDGLVGRYGGDEFVLLLTDLENEDELKTVLDEIIIRLQCDIGGSGEEIFMHCSVGVAVRKTDETIERWIEKADEALYFVKQNGKGYYKIYRE